MNPKNEFLNFGSKCMGSCYCKLRNYLRKSDSVILGKSALFLAGLIAKIFFRAKLPPYFRELVSLAQPINPLNLSALPTIDVAIPCHPKDYRNLPMVISGVRNSVLNPISQIRLITPSKNVKQLQSSFPGVKVLADEEILNTDTLIEIASHYPLDKRGWITQQAIKFMVVLKSERIATLLIDSDTVLIEPRAWINSNKVQAIDIACEFHEPYKKHHRRVFGDNTSIFSYVTHSQLMRKDVVTEIFGNNGEELLSWILQGSPSEPSPISEYDTYGEWLITHKPKDFIFTKWNNSGIESNLENYRNYEELAHDYSDFASVSAHSYLQ